MSINQIKLIYPIRSSTKYALLKSSVWTNRSIEWSAGHQGAKLQVFFDQTPMSLQWGFSVPSTLESIRKLSFHFEQDLFEILQNKDLMPQTPYLQTFHLGLLPPLTS